MMYLAITLDRPHCHDEGDGSGNAEPYLWPVFVEIDGQTYAYSPGVGLIGQPIVVMEEDTWPDRLATDGYVALVDAVKLAVVKATEDLQHAMRAPTPEEIGILVQGVKDRAAAMVRAAVKDSMDAWNLLWFGTVGDSDDQIGSEAFTMTSQQIRDDGMVELRKRRPADVAGDGDRELVGRAQRPPIPLRQHILAQRMNPQDGARVAMGQERSMHACLNR